MHQRDRNAWRGAAWQREDKCYLEVALNFFFDQKEIRSYQQAELQLLHVQVQLVPEAEVAAVPGDTIDQGVEGPA